MGLRTRISRTVHGILAGWSRGAEIMPLHYHRTGHHLETLPIRRAAAVEPPAGLTHPSFCCRQRTLSAAMIIAAYLHSIVHLARHRYIHGRENTASLCQCGAGTSGTDTKRADPKARPRYCAFKCIICRSSLRAPHSRILPFQ